MGVSILYARKDQGKLSVPFHGNEIKIGRDQGCCDIILDYDGEVSVRHARVFRLNDRYLVADLNSTNGTFVNNNRISGEVELHNKDIIRIGKVELTFINQEGLLENAFSHTYLSSSPVSMKNSPFTRHSLGDRQIIGRDPKSNIYLNHPQVSWKHAEVQKTGSTFILTDGGSTNGTYHNGRRISGSAPLNQNDIIQIGPFKLIFDGVTLGQLSEQENIRLDVAALSVIRDKKKILQSVNLSIKPRDFVAIVGTSGAGKSTLLRALCGAAFAEEGIVKINNIDFYDNFDSFRSMLGYVPQDDIIHRQLTVEDALRYAAELRLPSDTTSEEIDNIVNDTLTKLSMAPHAQKTVNSLSGGQRKRVSIAVEMLTNPSLFFLDEPTSGLDPATEKTLMELMKDRSRIDGKTVILVTHVTKNVDLCDKIIVMGTGGYLAFYGPPNEALKFFEVKDFIEIYDKIDNPGNARNYSAKFYNSEYYETYINRPLAEVGLSTEAGRGAAKHEFTPQKNRTSQIRQFFTLVKRYWNIKTKDLKNLVQTTGMLIGVCILLRIIFGDDVLNVNGESFGDASKLVFFFCCIALWFGTSGASLEIISELPIYLRESMINLRIIPYVLSKIFVLSIIAGLQTILISVVLLSFKAMREDLLMTCRFSAGVFAIFLVSICLGLCLSAFVKSPDGSSGWLPILLVLQIIFSGAIVPLNALDKDKTPLRYVSAIMPSRWSFTMLGETLKVNKMLYEALEEGTETDRILYKKTYGKFKGSFLSITCPVDESDETLKDYGKAAKEAYIALAVLSAAFFAISCICLWDKEIRREEFMK